MNQTLEALKVTMVTTATTTTKKMEVLTTTLRCLMLRAELSFVKNAMKRRHGCALLDIALFVVRRCNTAWGRTGVNTKTMQYSGLHTRRRYTCDTGTIGIEYLVDLEKYLGLVSANLDTDLMPSHALVAAEAEQAQQYDSDDEAYAAACTS
jgi:hypothetical protein